MISHSRRKRVDLLTFHDFPKFLKLIFDGMPPWSGIPFGRGQELSAERSWTLPGKPWIYQRVTAYDAKEWAARFGESSPQGVDVWGKTTSPAEQLVEGVIQPLFFSHLCPLSTIVQVYTTKYKHFFPLKSLVR